MYTWNDHQTILTVKFGNIAGWIYWDCSWFGFPWSQTYCGVHDFQLCYAGDRENAICLSFSVKTILFISVHVFYLYI